MSITETYEFLSEEDRRAKAYIQSEGARQEEVYERLTQLGKEAQRTKTDQVKKIDGTLIGVPKMMSDEQAAGILMRKAEAEQEDFLWARDYQCRPWDGAVCTQRLLKEMFGSALTPKKNESKILEVPINAAGDTEGVEFGVMQLRWANEIFEIWFQSHQDDKIGLAHRVIFKSTAKHAPFLVGLGKIIEEYIRDNSIYKGKSIILSNTETFPTFDNPYSFPREEIAYNSDEWDSLHESVLGLIENAEVLRAVDLPVVQQVLLAGEYGVGKTLALKVVAQVCNSNGFTFIQAKTGEDNLELVRSFAQLYAPAYVAIEDADHLAVMPDDDDGKKLSKLLQEFDGASDKGKEIGIVMTTNHWDKFPAPMRRPGRLDDVIHFNKWDREAFARGVSAKFSPDEIADVNWDEVWVEMENLTPAFIVSILNRTRSSAILRTGMSGQPLVTEDFLKVAKLKAPQVEQYEHAKALAEQAKTSSLEEALGALTQSKVVKALDGAYFEDDRLVLVK